MFSLGFGRNSRFADWSRPQQHHYTIDWFFKSWQCNLTVTSRASRKTSTIILLSLQLMANLQFPNLYWNVTGWLCLSFWRRPKAYGRGWYLCGNGEAVSLHMSAHTQTTFAQVYTTWPYVYYTHWYSVESPKLSQIYCARKSWISPGAASAPTYGHPSHARAPSLWTRLGCACIHDGTVCTPFV